MHTTESYPIQPDKEPPGAEQRTLGAVLYDRAKRWPAAAAIVCAGETLTYYELLSRAEKRSAQLRDLGLDKGDSVLLMMHNTLDFVDTWLGAALAGIVEVPINTDYKGEMLRHVIADSGASVIITQVEFLPRIEETYWSSSLQRVVVIDPSTEKETGAKLEVHTFAEATVAPKTEGESIRERDLVAVMYTSGTSGPAKGVEISHRHAYEYANAVREFLTLTPEDVYYAPLPLFHIAGQWAVFYASMIAGCPVVLKRRFSVAEFWEDCRSHAVTATFLLGAMAQFLQRQPPQPNDRDNPVDRVLMVPLVDELDAFRKRFAVQATTCYASTETCAPIGAGYDVDKPGVAGQCRQGYELRIVDEHDEEVPAGEVGELVIRHAEPWVTMVGYRNNPVSTARALRNMWLHSGDAMRLDDEGRYHFVDRVDDALRRRGENISSFEVEREVYAHDAVLECAAIGVPSRYTEDDLVVVCVAKPGRALKAEDLTEFLRNRMPRFMIPDQVVVTDEIPKTPTGKLKKQSLRERFAGEGRTSEQEPPGARQEPTKG